jgi:hypothetical protein
VSAASEQLLAEIAPLDPGDRIRRVVAVSRGLGEAGRAELVAELGRGDAYAARLAVVVAVAGGDPDHLAVAAHSAHPTVRARALGASMLPEPVLAAVLDDGPLADRVRVAARIRRGGHERMADAVLPLVRERWGDAEAAGLLAGCTAPVAAAALAELGYAVSGWAALIARHPEAVVAHAETELAAQAVEGRAAWWATSGRIVGALADQQPAATLALAERWLTGPLPWALLHRLHRLLAVDTVRVVQLVMADPERVGQLARRPLGRTARTRLAALPDAELGALLAASGPSPRLLATLLRTLPPHRRDAVFDLAHTGHDLATAVLPDEVLALLPHTRRHHEARRMLALPAVADSTAATVRISAFLPFAQARPVLDAATRSADADERATAYTLLVRAAAASGHAPTVTEVLDGLDRIPNEQDPVRSALLRAVGLVRPELFEAAAVPALDALVTGAVDARDASATSRDALHRLVFGLVAHPWPAGSAQSDWALATVDRLGAWQHGALLGPALRALPHGQEHVVFSRMRSRLAAAARRGDAWTVLAVARSLGRRAWAMPQLQDLVGEAMAITADGVPSAAVDVWLAPPATRLARIEVLLTRDASMVTLPRVAATLARCRPARLLALAGRPLEGRYGTRGASWLPTVAAGVVQSWSPAQVDAYTRLLRAGVADDGLVRSTRASVAAALAALAPTAVDDLLTAPDVLIAEAAMTGLGLGDRPFEALRSLLGHLDTDRARVALHAAARCARQIPPAWLAGVLDVPRAKVTARKELARWRARYRPDGALDALLDAWRRPGEHRDVRIAVLVALRSWTGDERVWAALDEAGRGDRYLAAAVLGAGPPAMAPAHRPGYGALVRRLTAHPEPHVARAALLALARWVPWARDAQLELTAAATDLTVTTTWRSAAAAALDPEVWTVLPDLLPAVVARLTAADDTPDADALRDRPARRRVAHVVDGLCRQGPVARRHPRPVLGVALLLAGDPAAVRFAARLRAVLVWPGPDFVEDLRALAALVAERPVAARAAAAELGVGDWDPADVGPAVDAMADAASAGAGHLGVTLIATAGPRAGWTGEWRARLRLLRAHHDPDVRDAALAVATAPE